MFAPAKINLTLNVLGKRPDGYHALFSLVSFADFGDELCFEAGGTAFTLDIAGIAGQKTSNQQTQNQETKNFAQDNLILKAAHALAAMGNVPFGHFTLTKRIPIAAGLGGGSADAACALRLLTKDVGLQQTVAKQIGADVSVCLESKPRFMRGIGHDLSPPLALPPLYALLVNPRIALSTKDVFVKLAAEPLTSLANPPLPQDIMAYMRASSNALETPAIALLPLLKDLLATLAGLKGAWLARLSGSGATCFALFNTAQEAKAAQSQMRAQFPTYFVKAVVLNG